jgi:hypothetical protein
MEINLKLVKEKKGILDHFTYPKILGIFLLLIATPLFFIIPFLGKNSMNWYFPFFIIAFIVFVVCWIVMILKYYTSYDYDSIGKLLLSDDKINIVFENEEKEIHIENVGVTLLYNGIRGRGFHYCKDYPRSGIFQLIINDSDCFYAIINNHEELESIKKILQIWYRGKYSIEEFTRTTEKYRLIELESNFEWSRLNEIKKKIKNSLKQ